MEKFTLIGHPLGHSISPLIHNMLFKFRNRDAEYTLTDITKLSAEVLREFRGFNVTIPYKKKVMSYLDDISNVADIGSVNCVNNTNDLLYGYNTDVFGFLKSIPHNICKGEILLFGFGGAGIMVANEVEKAKGTLTVVCRENGTSITEARMYCRNKCRMTVYSLEEFKPTHFERFNLLVNATPLGMYPDIDECPATEEVIKNSDFVFDAVYNPIKTKLLKTATKFSVPNVSGLKMLIYQAAQSHQIWHNDTYTETELYRIQTECEKALSNFQNPALNV
ncbi:MAG: shikimate dehydrogenase [Oscillospiraceae bacterium]|jgi:shikimate dehydrogenase|nr:shikimate dehydrogenase [Oscillospiraceae bacterium]